MGATPAPKDTNTHPGTSTFVRTYPSSRPNLTATFEVVGPRAKRPHFAKMSSRCQ